PSRPRAAPARACSGTCRGGACARAASGGRRGRDRPAGERAGGTATRRIRPARGGRPRSRGPGRTRCRTRGTRAGRSVRAWLHPHGSEGAFVELVGQILARGERERKAGEDAQGVGQPALLRVTLIATVSGTRPKLPRIRS